MDDKKINSNSTTTKQKLFFFPSFLLRSLPPYSSLTRLFSVVTTSLSPILLGTLDSFTTQNCSWKNMSWRSVKPLFILESELFMKKHVIKICQTVYFKLKRISSIRRVLTEDVTKTLVTSYIRSRLDYCNCLLMGTPNSVIQPLQKVQNFAARLILIAPRHHHSATLLKKLHWLPISERIKYKVACMCFHATKPVLHTSLTSYNSVSHASLFFWFSPAENPEVQMQDSWLLHLHLHWTLCLEFTPTWHQAMLNSSAF